MPDWVVPVIGLLGVILGASITEFRHWMERKERYQVITFEKRLEAHQRAFYWCMKVGNLFLGVSSGRSEYAEKFGEAALEALDWWNSNCLYLDESSRESMLDVLVDATEQAARIMESGEDAVRSSQDVRKKIEKAISCAVKGIGAKYLPEMGKQIGRR